MNNFQASYEKNIIKENVEFEICLGKQLSKHFTNCTSKETFYKIKNKLDSGNWNKIEDYNDTENVLRCDYKIINKVNISIYVKKMNKKYDFRFALNIVSPIEERENNSSTKYITNNKISYFKDFYSFNMTIINNDIYEIEMKLVDILYARKHSYNFIINHMIMLFNGLISSANFQRST